MKRWRWPLPALVAWGAGWVVMTLAGAMGLPAGGALLVGVLPAFATAPRAAPGWRRWAVLAGLPLSVLLVHGTSAVPAWAWLVAGLALLLIYPMQAWRDAPLFPTPPGALVGLPAVAPLAPGARILDAGSGLGDGLIALRRAYPEARLEGVEGGWLMVWASRWRLRPRRESGLTGAPPAAGAAGALRPRVRRGDFWREPWAPHDLVYLFQRPETMPRAWAKARAEMRPGAWLVSLEFEVPSFKPHAALACPDGRPLWVYRVP